MVTLSHPGRVGEARRDERKWARVGRAEAGGIRARVGEARGDEAGPA